MFLIIIIIFVSRLVNLIIVSCKLISVVFFLACNDVTSPVYNGSRIYGINDSPIIIILISI